MNNIKITKKLITPIACALLVACGGGGGSTTTDTPVPTPAPTPDPTPTPEPDANEADVTVTVDLNTKQFYGNVSQLQRNKFINMHESFSSSTNVPDAVLNEYVDQYNLGEGRQFWGPFSQNIFKNELDNNGKYPTEAQAISAGASSALSSLRNKTSNRVVVTEHPNNPMHNPEHNDPVKSGIWAANYFQHYFNDETRPLFYEPFNEPFIHAARYAEILQSWETNVPGLVYEGKTSADMQAYITEVHNEIGKAFRARSALDNVHILGFSSAWPSYEKNNFSLWESTMKMFMDGAGENIDGISVHLYDGINVKGQETKRSGSNSQAVLDLIETYSMIKFDKVKPHAITEYGNIVDQESTTYDPIANSQAIKTFNHIKLELMEREDRILTSIPFFGGYTTWFWQNNGGDPYNPAIWRPNPENLIIEGNTARFKPDNEIVGEKYLRNAKFIYLDFWKDVNGRRALINNTDPDVQVVSFVDDDKAYVVMSNLESGAKDVQLNLAQMTGYNFTSVKVERLKVPSDAIASLTEKTTSLLTAVDGSDIALGRIELDEFETVKYTFTLDKNIDYTSTMQRKSYYSDNHLLAINANTPVSFAINNIDLSSLDSQRSTAMLRVSIGRDIALNKQGTIKLNGTTVEMPDDWAGYDQANRTDFFGAIDVPINFALLQANNTVEITYPDSGGKVSSVILEVNNVIDDIEITHIEVTGDESDLYPDSMLQLTASVTPAFLSTEVLTWSSSDESIATVDQTGKVSALAEGEVTISVTSNNNTLGTKTLTVLQASSNLLFNQNSDFEQGETTHWTVFWQTPVEQFSITSEAANNGSLRGIHLTCLDDGFNCGISIPSTAMPQTIGENKGRRFKLSMDLKINSYQSGDFSFRYDIVSSSTGGWDARIHGFLPSVSSNEWTTVSQEFDEADWLNLADPARFEGYFTSNSTALKNVEIDAYIDNISIVEVIE